MFRRSLALYPLSVPCELPTQLHTTTQLGLGGHPARTRPPQLPLRTQQPRRFRTDWQRQQQPLLRLMLLHHPLRGPPLDAGAQEPRLRSKLCATRIWVRLNPCRQPLQLHPQLQSNLQQQTCGVTRAVQKWLLPPPQEWLLLTPRRTLSLRVCGLAVVTGIRIPRSNSISCTRSFIAIGMRSLLLLLQRRRRIRAACFNATWSTRCSGGRSSRSAWMRCCILCCRRCTRMQQCHLLVLCRHRLRRV